MRDMATIDADRFLTLLKPIERDLETYARRLVWDVADAPDALQNAVMRAFAAFDRYHEDGSFRAWMFKILTHEAFALNRKYARIAKHEFQLEPADLAKLPGGSAMDKESNRQLSAPELDDLLDEQLAAGLRTLTDNERAVLLLRAVGELRYREIGETLDIPMGSVMGHLARARQKMRSLLKRAARRAETLEDT
jgi:RNA polymerase sigma-70 factor (ECF subfamily)